MITIEIEIDDDITEDMSDNDIKAYVENALASGIVTHPGSPFRGGLAAEVIFIER